MTTAQALIEEALDLINVPGGGGALSGALTRRALRMLRSIIAQYSTGEAIQPGRRRHFFSIPSGKARFTYGPGGDFDTTPFGDGAPIRIERLFVRQNGSIVDNEILPDYGFDSGSSGWTFPDSGDLLEGTEFGVFNGRVRWLGDSTAVSHTLGTVAFPGTGFTTLDATKRYVFSFDAEVVQAGLWDLGPIGFYQSGAGTAAGDYNLLTGALSSSGHYSFDYYPVAATNQLRLFAYPQTGPVDFTVDNISLLEYGKERLELAESGTDYPVKLVDAETIHRITEKHNSGKSDCAFFSPGHNLATLTFDVIPSVGDVVVLDVIRNPAAIARLSDTVPLQEHTLEFLRWKLAANFAPTVGKQVSAAHASAMRAAFYSMAAGNHRPASGRMDPAMVGHRQYSIDHGDYI